MRTSLSDSCLSSKRWLAADRSLVNVAYGDLTVILLCRFRECGSNLKHTARCYSIARTWNRKKAFSEPFDTARSFWDRWKQLCFDKTIAIIRCRNQAIIKAQLIREGRTQLVRASYSAFRTGRSETLNNSSSWRLDRIFLAAAGGYVWMCARLSASKKKISIYSKNILWIEKPS